MKQNNKITFVIGKNGTGKSIAFKNHFKENEENSYFIKMIKIKKNNTSKQAHILDINFEIETSFQSNSTFKELFKSNKFLKIIDSKKQTSSKFIKLISKENKNKSLGEKNLLCWKNIIKILSKSENSESVLNFYLEEPSEFLDHSNKKELAWFLSEEMNLNINLKIITHSDYFLYQMCKLNETKKNILYISKPENNQNLYRCNAGCFEKKNKTNENAKTKYTLSNSFFFKIENLELIENFSKNFNYCDFYKIFFVDKVILVEGLADKILINKILDEKFLNLEKEGFFLNQRIYILNCLGKKNILSVLNQLIENFYFSVENFFVMWDEDKHDEKKHNIGDNDNIKDIINDEEHRFTHKNYLEETFFNLKKNYNPKLKKRIFEEKVNEKIFSFYEKTNNKLISESGLISEFKKYPFWINELKECNSCVSSSDINKKDHDNLVINNCKYSELKRKINNFWNK